MGRFTIIGLIIYLCTGCTKAPHGELYKEAAVVTAHKLATEEGLRILKKGGNAIDAAVAVQAVLAVVYPSAGNIGGGGFMVYRQADDRVYTLDFRETAPLAAHEKMYLDAQGRVIDKKSTHGVLSAGVPGSVAGMWEMHRLYGHLSWESLFERAIELAHDGFQLTAKEALKLKNIQGDLVKYNPVLPTQFINADWHEGDTLVQTDLAETLTRIAKLGPVDFYKGETARLLTTCMELQNGLISTTDLAAYETIWRDPLLFHFDDYTFYSMAPPSSGGIVMGQILKLVEPYKNDFSGHNSADYMHLLIEAERRAYADRAEYLGDPAFVRIPQKELLHKAHLTTMWETFRNDLATPSTTISAFPIEPEKEQTTHFSIVDAEGNAVAITTTLNGAFGSKVVVPGAGFFLNNEMDDFSIKPGFANSYGVTGNKANKIEPRKRMLSSMSPTIIMKNKDLYMVLGSPGGSTIITSVVQTFLNATYFDMTLQQAVDTPRFHSQWLPDVVYIEKDRKYKMHTQAQLRLKGHTIVKREPIGRVDAIRIWPKGLEVGADSRGDDTGIGY